MMSDYAGAWLAPGARKILGAALGQALPASGSVLDVGCGAASWLWLTGAQPVGLDRDARAVARFALRGRAVVGDAVALPFAAKSFDAVVSIGLLHHLDDAQANLALHEMHRVARGKILVFDAVMPRATWCRPLPWAIRRLDRGRWMRSERALKTILDRHGMWRSRRLTYSWTGLEGLLSLHTLSS